MAEALVEDPPYIQRSKGSSVDWVGFGLLATWLATLQIVLDRGQEEDWFHSNWICWFTAIAGVGLVSFVLRELCVEHPVVDLRVLANRNFVAGLALITMLGVVLYGTTAAIPIYLQTLMGYTALGSGYALSPRGVAAFLTTIVVGAIGRKSPQHVFVADRFCPRGDFVVHARPNQPLGGHGHSDLAQCGERRRRSALFSSP